MNYKKSFLKVEAYKIFLLSLSRTNKIDIDMNSRWEKEIFESLNRIRIISRSGRGVRLFSMRNEMLWELFSVILLDISHSISCYFTLNIKIYEACMALQWLLSALCSKASFWRYSLLNSIECFFPGIFGRETGSIAS